MINELEQAIYDIACDVNDIHCETGGSEEIELIHTTNGFYSVVKFLGITVYNCQDSNRLCDDDTGEYTESVEDNIRRNIKEVIQHINEFSKLFLEGKQ